MRPKTASINRWAAAIASAQEMVPFIVTALGIPRRAWELFGVWRVLSRLFLFAGLVIVVVVTFVLPDTSLG